MIPVPICALHVLASLMPQLANQPAQAAFFASMAGENQKAIAAVKTLSCQFKTIDILPNRINTLVTEMPAEGVYLRKGADFRSTYRFQQANNRLQNCSIRNGVEIHVYERRTPPDRLTIQAIGSKKSDDPGQLLNRLLVNHVLYNESDFNLFSLDELRALPHRIVKTEVQKNGDVETRYLQLVLPYGKLEFWLDRNSHGWLRKVSYTPSMNPADKHEWEVLKFHRAADGAVIPALVSRKYFMKGNLKGHVHTELTEIRLNEPLADKELSIPDLAGKVASDLDRQVRYVVDEMGNRVGPEMSDPTQLNMSQPQPIYPDLGNENAFQKETITIADLLAILFVAVLVLSGLGWLLFSGRKAVPAAVVSGASTTPGSPPSRNVPTGPRVRRF